MFRRKRSTNGKVERKHYLMPRLLLETEEGRRFPSPVLVSVSSSRNLDGEMRKRKLGQAVIEALQMIKLLASRGERKGFSELQ